MPVELFCQFLPAHKGAVGYKYVGNPGLEQMHGGQFGHFARAHKHGLVFAHVAENAFCQFHGGIADGNRAGSHGGFSAYSFGHRKSFVQQTVEDDPRGAAFDSLAVGCFQLPENLGFAQHH